MDTLTKSMQGNTKPLGMTGTVPGIENLPTSFGGQKPIDYMMPKHLDPAMSRTPLGPLGPQGSSYMPSGTGFDPMSSKQDLVDYVAANGSSDDAKKAEEALAMAARSKQLKDLTKQSQDMLFQQGFDLNSSIRRRR